jgi:hypothetical protein
VTGSTRSKRLSPGHFWQVDHLLPVVEGVLQYIYIYIYIYRRVCTYIHIQAYCNWITFFLLSKVRCGEANGML